MWSLSDAPWRSTADEVHTWWFIIRDSNDYPIKVTLQARDAYTAMEMARGMYGDRLISEHACLA